jgi:putative ABC transport system permease protein
VSAWLSLSDAVVLAATGLRAQRVRSALSALGIALGIAAGVAVLGIAESSKADLIARLGEEGNLLTVASVQTVDGRAIPLPATAQPMIERIPPVRAVTAVGAVDGVTVRRSAAIPAVRTSGISVLAAQPSLPAALSARVLRGRVLDRTAEHYPATVLGHEAARVLGIGTLTEPTQVYLGGHYFAVVGVLAPVPVAPEIDIAALIGFPVAGEMFGLDGGPSRIYLRVEPDHVAAVRWASWRPWSPRGWPATRW